MISPPVAGTAAVTATVNKAGGARERQRQVHLLLMSAPRPHPALVPEVPVPEVAAGLRLGRTALAAAAVALLAALALASPPWFSARDGAAPRAGDAHARGAVRVLPAGLLTAASKAMGASDRSYWATRRGTELDRKSVV